MANRNKAKGTQFESDVVGYFNDNGFKTERRALHGNLDKGDIIGIPNFVAECKNTKTIALGSFVDQAMVERKNAGEDFGAAIIKRKGKNVSEAYVAMPLHQFVELVKRLG